MGQYVPPLSIKTDPLVRVIATPPSEAGRITRVICQEVTILSALDIGKVKVTVDIGPLIDAAVRSGFDDEDEPGCNHNESNYIHQGPFTFDVGELADEPLYEIGIDYQPGNDRKPVTIFLGNDVIYHGDGIQELPLPEKPVDPIRAEFEEKIARLREVIEQKKRERGENPEEEPTK